MRSRGTAGVKVFTGDDVIEQYGVAKGSYDEIALPKIDAYTVRSGGRAATPSHACKPAYQHAHDGGCTAVSACLPPRDGRALCAHSALRYRHLQVRCKRAGVPAEVLEVGQEPIPQVLEWGQVLLSVRYAPINPADL